MSNVFITGATGYMGRALIPELLARGRRVRALVRPGSERKLAPGAIAILGDALDSASVREAMADDDVLVTPGWRFASQPRQSARVRGH